MRPATRAIIALAGAFLTACQSLPAIIAPAPESSGPVAPALWEKTPDGVLVHVPSGAACPAALGRFAFAGIADVAFVDAGGTPLSDGVCQYTDAAAGAGLTVYIYEAGEASAQEEMDGVVAIVDETYRASLDPSSSHTCKANIARLTGMLGGEDGASDCLVFDLAGQNDTALVSLATVAVSRGWAMKVRATGPAADASLLAAMQDAALAWTAGQFNAVGR